LIPWFAGIQERIGYLGEHRYGLLTIRLQNPSRQSRNSMVAHYLALAQENTASEKQSPLLDLPLSVLQESLAALQLQSNAYMVLAPGAEYGPAKRWPTKHFSELAILSDKPVVLLGSAKEAALCEDIASAANEHRPGSTRSLAGKTNLTQAMAAIAAAHSVVSNDSGLMHVAAAFGVPQVALFGSSSPIHTPPLNSRAAVLWLKNVPAYQPPLDCAPCFKRDCPLEHTRCLNDLSPQMVAQAWAHLVSG
jgi:heptosyltransferase-2